jgi:phosphate transport system protein
VRERFQQTLGGLEREILEDLGKHADGVVPSVQAVLASDRPGAARVLAATDELEGRRARLQRELLTFLARQAPVAADLRVATALLDTLTYGERIGHQCASIAKLARLSGVATGADEGPVQCLRAMAPTARDQVVLAREAFAARDVALARQLEARDDVLDHGNRECFRMALAIGDDRDTREWAMYMVLVARALERIGDNAVDVGRSVEFVCSGRPPGRATAA